MPRAGTGMYCTYCTNHTYSPMTPRLARPYAVGSDGRGIGTPAPAAVPPQRGSSAPPNREGSLSRHPPRCPTGHGSPPPCQDDVYSASGTRRKRPRRARSWAARSFEPGELWEHPPLWKGLLWAFSRYAQWIRALARTASVYEHLRALRALVYLWTLRRSPTMIQEYQYIM